MADRDTILLWGPSSDPPLAAVADALRRAGCPLVFLDQHTVLDTQMSLSVSDTVAGELRLGNERLDLSSVKAVYLRPCDSRELPCVVDAGAGSAAWHHALALQDMMSSWCELTPALALNRPIDMAANSSKPYQSLLIEAQGFRIPDTLLTTDPDAAAQFWRHHGRVIYKSLSATRSIVSCVTDEHVARFDNIANCPTQFQQYVEGTEYRVHVVGEDLLACAIQSTADDYRYTTEPVAMQACELPPDIATRCRRLAESMNLPLAGLDLRCTAEGTWYCFEVNPSPGFTYFQHATGQPIAESIARLLQSAGTQASPNTQTLPS